LISCNTQYTVHVF